MGSNGYTHGIYSQPKVFRHNVFKNVVIGSTSSFRHIDLLRYSENLLPEIDMYKKTVIDHEYMVKTFIPNLIKLFENGIKDDSNKGGNFLIGIDNQLFEIQNDYSVMIPQCGFASVGCGEVAAMGALYTMEKYYQDTMAIDKVQFALEAAQNTVEGVHSPFILLNTKTSETITKV